MFETGQWTELTSWLCMLWGSTLLIFHNTFCEKITIIVPPIGSSVNLQLGRLKSMHIHRETSATTISECHLDVSQQMEYQPISIFG